MHSLRLQGAQASGVVGGDDAASVLQSGVFYAATANKPFRGFEGFALGQLGPVAAVEVGLICVSP